ncbi:hypothetical protein BUY39_12890, partial [Staphylococcus cohnii]
MTGAVLLFLIPAKSHKGGLLIWDDMSKLPWGILLLFGGVEMGNMKAQVEDTATIPIIMKGSWLIAAAKPILIGINIF